MPLFGRFYIPTNKRSDYVATEERIFQWAWVREPSGREQGLLIDARGDYRSTAIAVGIFVERLWPRAAKSELPAGFVRIQDVLDLDDVRDAFEERGISVRDWDPGYGDASRSFVDEAVGVGETAVAS